MAWCINQIERVGFPIACCVLHLYRMQFDRNTPFLLERIIIEDLIGNHLAGSNTTSPFEQAIGKRGFAVVNVGNDAKVSK